MRILYIAAVFIFAGLAFESEGLAQSRVFPEGFMSVADLRRTYPGIGAQVDAVLPAVVHVRVRDPQGNLVSQASGIVAEDAETLVVRTAFHVVESMFLEGTKCRNDLGTLEITDVDGMKSEKISCESFSNPTSLTTDIVTLRVSGDWKPLKFHQPSSLDTGDEVLVIGFPAIYSAGPVISMGHILLPIDSSKKRISTTIAGSPGLSGAVALRVGGDGRLSLLGHVVQGLNANPVARVRFKYRWGTNAVASRSACLSQEELNGVLYNGSRADIAFRSRVVRTTKYLLDLKPCATERWEWSGLIEKSLSAYRRILNESQSSTGGEFSERYFKWIQSDPLKAIKWADFPFTSGDHVGSLEGSSRQLDRFQAKLDRIKKLFPSTGRVEDWLNKIEKLNLQNDLNAVNDYFLFGLTVIQLW